MKKTSPNPALSATELTELEELLAGLPEQHNAMEADEADGFITAVRLASKPIPPEAWLPHVLDAAGHEPGEVDCTRLKSLLLRRSEEIENLLKKKCPVDPIILEDGEGGDAGDELAGFALGFLAAMQLFTPFKPSAGRQLSGALLGIFRHLPPELQGDLALSVSELERHYPYRDSRDAMEDLAACVAEIAEVTRGFTIPD